MMHRPSAQPTRFYRRASIAVLVAAIVSCNDGTAPIETVPVAKVAITPGNATLKSLGDTVRFSAVASDSVGNALLGRRQTWSSSNPAVVKIDSSGLATSVADGSASITASVETIAANAAVTVIQTAAAIDVTPSSLTFASIGDTGRFTVVAKDQLGNVLPNITWTSPKPSIATVDNTGLVTALANGTTTLVVSAGGTKQVPVTVSQVPVSLAVTPSSHTFNSLKETFRFTAVLKDARGNLVTNKFVAWQSFDASVAVITGSGDVTSQNNGTAKIKATYQTLSDSVSITVAQVAADFAVVPANPKGWVGAQLELTAGPRDAKGNLMPLTAPLTWTSADPSIATVATDGRVTVLSGGSARITATSGAASANADLTLRSTMGDTVNVNTTLPKRAYQVTGNVVVARGSRLRIQPGATMAFGAGLGMTVNGTLVAIGTTTDSIRFTSSGAQAGPATWQGIVFSGAVSAAVDANGNYVSGSGIAFADIGYSRQLNFGSSSAYLGNSHVHDIGRVMPDLSGAVVACAGGVIRDNVIEDNLLTGLMVAGSIVVRQNLVRRNRATDQEGTGPNYLGGGIHVRATGCSSDILPDGAPIVEDNTIVENVGGGFPGAGITVWGGSPVIRYNDIRGNILLRQGNGAGVAAASATSTFSYNNIEDNSCDRPEYCAALFFANGANIRFENNNVRKMGEHTIRTYGSFTAPLVAGSNYWDGMSMSDVTASIATPIVGTINLSPVLTQRVSGAGRRPP